MEVITIDYILEELNENRPVLDRLVLDKLLPSNEDGILHNKSAEELLYYINEGYIKIEIEKCCSDVDEYHLKKQLLEQYEEDFTLFVKKAFGKQVSPRETEYDYLVWNWLRQKGETVYEPKRSNLSFFGPTLKVSGRMFNCKTKYVIDRLKRGDNAFLFVLSDNKDIYFVLFNNTDTFRQYLKKKKKNELELKKEYHNHYDKKEIEEMDQRKFRPEEIGCQKNSVQKYDLVCWLDKDENTLKKGLVIVPVEPGLDAIKVMQEIPYTGFVHSRRVLVGDPKSLEKRCLVKVIRDNVEEYHIPFLSNLYVVMTRDEADLSRLVTSFLDSTEEDIEYELIDDNKGNWNAAYIPIQHKIEIDRFRMYNTIIQSFIDENILPNEIVALKLSHELGHADKRSEYNYTNNYEEKIRNTNQQLNEIHRLCKGSYNEANQMSIEELKGLKQKIDSVCNALYEYNQMELRTEREAWKFGRVFVPSHLLSYYDRTNWESYKGYVKTNAEMLWSIHYYQSYVDCLIAFHIKRGLSRYEFLLKKMEDDKRQKFDDLKRKFSMSNYPDDYLFSSSEVKEIYNAFNELDRYDRGRMKTEKIRYRIKSGKIKGAYERRGYEMGYVAYKTGVIEFMRENGIDPFYE